MKEIVRSITYGFTDSANAEQVGPKFLRITDIQNGTVNWETVPYCKCAEVTKYALKNGDIVVARTGATTGKSFLISELTETSVFASYLIRLETVEDLSASFLIKFMQTPHYWRQITTVSQGSAQPGANASVLSKLDIPLPPLAEQRRIVTKIESLQERSRKAREALSEVGPLLEQFRQSLLAAAFRGDLTADWRAANPNVEPASELLNRIRQERRQKWEQSELAKYKAKGEQPPKDQNNNRREPRPSNSELEELPKSWRWCRVDDVGDVQLGRQRSPQYHSGPNMRPYLRVMNVYEDRIDIGDVMEMDFSNADYDRYKLSQGDILLNEGQSFELVGRSAIYCDEIPGACFTNTLVRFRAIGPITCEYPQIVFLAYLKTGRFQRIASRTVNIAHLGAGRFSEMEFPLPPLEEQVEIVRQVRNALYLIDSLKTKLASTESELTQLDQSILAKAFRGELVPQDPNDEPASVLLERIRVARQQTTSTKPSKQRSSAKGRK